MIRPNKALERTESTMVAAATPRERGRHPRRRRYAKIARSWVRTSDFSVRRPLVMERSNRFEAGTDKLRDAGFEPATSCV
jgi:hypothetical protein